MINDQFIYEYLNSSHNFTITVTETNQTEILRRYSEWSNINPLIEEWLIQIHCSKTELNLNTQTKLITDQKPNYNF